MSKITLDHLRQLRVTNLSLLAWDFVSLSTISPPSGQRMAGLRPHKARVISGATQEGGLCAHRKMVCVAEAAQNQMCWIWESQITHLPPGGAWTSPNCSFPSFLPLFIFPLPPLSIYLIRFYKYKIVKKIFSISTQCWHTVSTQMLTITIINDHNDNNDKLYQCQSH